MTFLQHPYILRVFAVVVADEAPNEPVGLLLQLVGPSLKSVCATIPAPAVSALLSLLMKAALGLQFAHSLRTVHADVKPENILVSLDGRDAMLSDFGTSHVMTTKMTAVTGVRGTSFYIAPEHLDDGHELTPKCDVHSFALTMWVVLHPPGTDHGLGKSDRAIERSIEAGKRPTIDATRMPPAVAALMQACWDPDPAKRPTMEQVAASLSASAAPTTSHPHRYVLDALGVPQLLRSYDELTWSDTPDGYLCKAVVPSSHPMHEYVLRHMRQSTKLPHTIGRIHNVTLVQHKVWSEGWSLQHTASRNSRGQNPALSIANPTDAESIAGIDFLKQLFAPESITPPPKSRVVLMWYGTAAQFIDPVCRDGPRSFRITDPSYFGAGSYTAAEANYAARYSAMGDGTQTGKHTIVLCACSLSDGSSDHSHQGLRSRLCNRVLTVLFWRPKACYCPQPPLRWALHSHEAIRPEASIDGCRRR